MAIDPKLVSIIPASQLPTGDPTSAADFLFYEGETLQTSPMSNIYDKVTSGIKGVATQTNAPTVYTPEAYPNGLFETYVVRKPLTLPNSWGSAVTQAELDANYVYFDVRNGVISKSPSLKPLADLTPAVLKANSNFSYDVFPITVSPNLNAIKYAKITGNLEENKIFYIASLEKNASYRRIWISKCDLDGLNPIRVFDFLQWPEDFVDKGVIEINGVGGLKIKLIIDWTEFVGTGFAGSYTTANFLPSVYFPNADLTPYAKTTDVVLKANSNFSYDVFPITVSPNFKGIKYAKITGNLEENKIFYIASLEKK